MIVRVPPVRVADVVYAILAGAAAVATLVRRTPVVLYGAGKVNLPRTGKVTAALGRTPVLVADSRRPPGVGDSARAAGGRPGASMVRTAAAPICSCLPDYARFGFIGSRWLEPKSQEASLMRRSALRSSECEDRSTSQPDRRVPFSGGWVPQDGRVAGLDKIGETPYHERPCRLRRI